MSLPDIYEAEYSQTLEGLDAKIKFNFDLNQSTAIVNFDKSKTVWIIDDTLAIVLSTDAKAGSHTVFSTLPFDIEKDGDGYFVKVQK